MKFLILVCIFFAISAFTIEKDGEQRVAIGVRYYRNMFGHLHQSPSVYSPSLTTISCGHPVKIFKIVKEKTLGEITFFNNHWNLAKVGNYYGHIDSRSLSKKKGKCFQDKYPKFFERFDVSLADLYYWGRLHDLYIKGRSKVR